MPSIEITTAEFTDRMAIQNLKLSYQDSELREPQENLELYQMLFDVHSAMYPMHDILVRTKNIELKAYLGEVILKLNGIRAKLKGDSRTYA